MIYPELTYEQCLLQGLGPLVFPDRLERGVEPAMRVQMMQVCMQNMQHQAQMEHILRLSWQALVQAGVQPVLMKGAGLAQYYPSPDRRQWNDVDIYVGPTQYHAACAAMREAWPEALRFDEEKDYYKHYNLIADGVSVEIHRVTILLNHPRDIRRYAEMEHEAAKNACQWRMGEMELRVFEPTFNAMYVMMHAWEHFLTAGATIRQLYDIGYLIEKEHGRIHTDRLKRDLRALRLTEVWQLYMYILVQHAGLDKHIAPLYTDTCAERAERMWKALQGENAPVSQKQAAPKNRWARKIWTMRQRMGEAKRIQAYSPAYARHMCASVLLHGALRLFAKDRKWE